MTRILKGLIQSADRTLFDLYLRLFEERSSLITFLFHEVYSTKEEIELNHKHPHQKLTLEHFRRFVEYYLESGYEFTGIADIPEDLSPAKKYVLITFDDGYFNNNLVLPILREYGIPAVFFISTNHVRHNKCFWWDVLYRERAVRGVDGGSIETEIAMLKSKKSDEIESYIADNFGKDAMTPISDIDRPMTETELRVFATEEYVSIGNHTLDHAILTNYDSDEVNLQVGGARRYLEQVTGEPPDSISYPNGNYSEEIIRTCLANGLRIGITVESRKNHLPLDQTDDLFRLGRFMVHGNDRIESQCKFFRSDIAIYSRLKKLLGRGVTVQ